MLLPLVNPSKAEIAERVARYHRLRHLGVLWPELSARDFHIAQQAIAQATSAILAGDGRASPVVLPPHGDLRAFGVVAYITGMGPLFGYWVEQGRLSVDEPVAEVLARHLAHGRRRAVRLRGELDRILAALEQRQITAVVLKGSDSAHRYFPDPGTRPLADLDLLVSPEGIAGARESLAALGFVEEMRANLPLRSEWMMAGATKEVHALDLNHADNPWTVDLHLTLDRAIYPGLNITFGPVDIDAQPQWNGSSYARVLGQPLHLAYLACHTVDHLTMHLHRLVELALVVLRDFAGRPAAWDAFVGFVARTGTARFAYASLELMERLVPGTLDPAVRAYLTRRAPRQLQRAVHAIDLGSLVQLRVWGPRGRLMWAATPRDYLAYLAHLVWPQTPAGPVGLSLFLREQAGRLRRVLSQGWRRVTRAGTTRD